MNVTVVVATFGTQEWETLGDEAARSVEGVPVIRVHGSTLAQARNYGLAQVKTDRTCFLDADDGLEPGYFDRSEDGDVLVTPLDHKVPRAGGHRHMCRAACLPEGNYVHVGAIASTALLREVGGFREHPIYEDWDLWLRCANASGVFTHSGGSSYITKLRGQGNRNDSLTPREQRAARMTILNTYRKAQP